MWLHISSSVFLKKMTNSPIQIKIEGTIKFCNGIATPLAVGKPLRLIQRRH